MAERAPYKVATALLAAHNRWPEQRVGQLISNALDLAGIKFDYFYVEDETLAQALFDYADIKK